MKRAALWLAIGLGLPTIAHATLITVTDAGDVSEDDGLCTLREAITAANEDAASGGGLGECPAGQADVPDRIAFALGRGPAFITPTSALPTIAAPIAIDGRTQPGFVSRPLIVLDGGAAGDVPGLRVAAVDDVELRGLVIQRFAGPGIELAGARGAVVTGNFIGVDVTGLAAAGNGLGVVLGPLSSACALSGNTISGNAGAGIRVDAGGTDLTGGHELSDNRIGLDADGVTPLGNGGAGLEFDGGVRGARVGAGNMIAHNVGAGVVLSDDDFNVVITGNSIFDNGSLGIDLGDDGPSPPDPRDADVGANGLQNAPALRTIASTPAGGGFEIHVGGALESTPAARFAIEIFDNDTLDPSGSGEGQRRLGVIEDVQTDAAGRAIFEGRFVADSPAMWVSATATPVGGGTSEFSLDDADGVDAGAEDRNQNGQPNDDDTDGDGTPDWLDADDDGDGIATLFEAADVRDTDGDGRPDHLDDDDDGDGTPTAEESPDPNGDGDPADAADSDGDGRPDFIDDDGDGDDVPDVRDNCRGRFNPDQADFDGDGMGDACGDSDGDGVVDADDNCPAAPNPDQADGDLDGVGDACDRCPDDLDPDRADRDGDAIGDACDNCPAAPNADQADLDGDADGDACDDDADGDEVASADDCDDLDPTVGAGLRYFTDLDGDGVGDTRLEQVSCDGVPPGAAREGGDNCPDIANPDQADGDGDGSGDACDRIVGCDTDGPDTDGPDTDGLDTDGLDTDGLDTDNDGTPDVCDDDDDDDGLPDIADSCPLEASPATDGCPEPSSTEIKYTGGGGCSGCTVTSDGTPALAWCTLLALIGLRRRLCPHRGDRRETSNRSQ